MISSQSFIIKFYLKLTSFRQVLMNSSKVIKSPNFQLIPTNFPLIFLANFPSFDISQKTDYLFTVSLLLYNACVQRENEFFQKCCKQLDARQQSYIAKFFKFLKAALDRNATISRELIKEAIREAVPPPTTPQFNFLQLGSPLSTPKACKSPSTPNREMFNEKIRELKSIKTQLENERYEKSLLESEMKQNLDKIESLGKFRWL